MSSSEYRHPVFVLCGSDWIPRNTNVCSFVRLCLAQIFELLSRPLFLSELCWKCEPKILVFSFNEVRCSDCPDIDFLGDNAPVSVVIVRADDVKVLHVLLDNMVDLSLPEHVVVAVVGQ